ncbi:azurin [Tamlana sp. 2_MG-2023]|uniref:azurin n=1 Tax=unclassified Tamlana TaxID=2614803 RepID=UPI0026E3F70D|nr:MULTISPECIES: azurin [unclassified Tamlana]MDO6760683.1 azurin [Tamlana sp. 2_MG-2023]MDO6790939.1 azurin [Tamlana sp. 1_MG-2023]
MKNFKYLLGILVLSILISCGNQEKKASKSAFETQSETSTQDTSVKVIEITANDAMQFNTSKIEVQAGDKVKIVLKHVGKMPKNVMGHNFVLLKKGVDLVKFGNKAATEKDSEYIPDDGDDVIAHTKLIGGGETAAVEFNAPESGSYDFLCSFPGHFAIMKGKFVVK